MPSALANPAGSPSPSVAFSPDQAAVRPGVTDARPGRPYAGSGDRRERLRPDTPARAGVGDADPGSDPDSDADSDGEAKATPAPTPRDTVWNARTYVKNRVGAKGYDCINAVWTGESKWNPRAGTPTGAYGIPQAFPGTKMAAFGSNWRYSPLTQVKWGLWYVTTRYGSACAAYTFWKANGWY